MSDRTAFEALLATAQLAELGPGPREGVDSEAAVTSRVRQLGAALKIPNDRQEVIRAAALLWHDHLDAAHSIAQVVENADGAFVHGMMHRREPDYSNAAYWFRRVGQHGAFPELAKRVDDLLKAQSDQALKRQLLPGGRWDPFRFIDACQAAAAASSSREQTRLREVQRLEFEVLLDWLSREPQA